VSDSLSGPIWQVFEHVLHRWTVTITYAAASDGDHANDSSHSHIGVTRLAKKKTREGIKVRDSNRTVRASE
jgi:hypothetical protein